MSPVWMQCHREGHLYLFIRSYVISRAVWPTIAIYVFIRGSGSVSCINTRRTRLNMEITRDGRVAIGRDDRGYKKRITVDIAGATIPPFHVTVGGRYRPIYLRAVISIHCIVVPEDTVGGGGGAAIMIETTATKIGVVACNGGVINIRYTALKIYTSTPTVGLTISSVPSNIAVGHGYRPAIIVNGATVLVCIVAFKNGLGTGEG